MVLTRFLWLTATLLSLAANTLAQQPETTTDKPPAAEATETAPAPAAPPPRPRPPLKNPERRDMALLAKSVEAHTVAWLQAGDEKFLALYEPDRTGQPQGALLILHDQGQHPNWPEILENIRSTLPDFGWATLAAALPSPDGMDIPPRPTPPAEAATEGESGSETTLGAAAPESAPPQEQEEIFDAATGQLVAGEETATSPRMAEEEDRRPAIPAERRVAQRMRAALAFLQEKGQFNTVLLGDGIGAARVGNFLCGLAGSEAAAPGKGGSKPVQAAILIDARNRIPSTDVDLPSCLQDPDMPVLDIYFGTDRRAIQEAMRRKRSAGRNRLSVYQQIRLPRMAGDFGSGENRVTRRVRGFLSKYVQGMEINKN